MNINILMEILPIILIVQLIIIIISILILRKLKNLDYNEDSIYSFFISSGICLVMFVSILIMSMRQINGIKNKVGAPGKRGFDGKDGMLGPPGSR